jgi:hypothetical protein
MRARRDGGKRVGRDDEKRAVRDLFSDWTSACLRGELCYGCLGSVLGASRARASVGENGSDCPSGASAEEIIPKAKMANFWQELHNVFLCEIRPNAGTILFLLPEGALLVHVCSRLHNLLQLTRMCPSHLSIYESQNCWSV